MFEARYAGTCDICKGRFPAGAPIVANGNITRADKTVRAFAHAWCRDPKAFGLAPLPRVEDPNALELAVEARDLAEELWCANEYRWATRSTLFNPSSASYGRMVEAREALLQDMIDARMAAMLEADAVGIINLFDRLEDYDELADNAVAIGHFSGVPEATTDRLAQLAVEARQRENDPRGKTTAWDMGTEATLQSIA